MKPIFCLEAAWWKNSYVTVRPYLETLRMLNKVSFDWNQCNTVGDLRHFLSKSPPRAKGILYFAMHGRRGRLAFTNGTEETTLSELVDMMGNRYAGWHIHFACCETINTSDRIFQEFKKKTEAGIVSGYTTQVDWIEGYALDMLLLSTAQRYARPSFLAKAMYKNYSDLMGQTGMYID